MRTGKTANDFISRVFSLPGLRGLGGLSGLDALLALPAAHDRTGLQRHGKCDESDACVEGRTEVAGLAEDDHGEDDRVDRFEVVGEVDREGRDVLERLDLQDVHEERAEDREDRQIERVGPGRDEGLGRHERDVDGDRHAGEGEAAEQLPAHDGDARVLGAVALEVDGQKRRCCGAHEAERNAEAVLRVEVEDERDAEDRHEREEHLAQRYAGLVHQRLDERREKADRREGHDADAHVRGLDRGIEERPLHGEKRAHAHDRDPVARRHLLKALRQPGPEPQAAARNHDAPEDDEAGREHHELAEDAGPAGQKNGDVKLKEGLFHGAPPGGRLFEGWEHVGFSPLFKALPGAPMLPQEEGTCHAGHTVWA